MTLSFEVDRRTTIKWVLATLGSTGIAAGCGRNDVAPVETFRLGTARPLRGQPYGPDPDMVEGRITWPLTMTEAQLRMVSVLLDMILPATDGLPPASQLGIPAFIDEWVSSPYEMTKSNRKDFFALWEWMEGEAQSAGASFADQTQEARHAILDRIAWEGRVEEGLETQARAFGSFRYLATSAVLASDEGSAWIGYMGNRPIMGDYPGPTPDALDHLSGVLDDLGLTMPEGL